MWSQDEMEKPMNEKIGGKVHIHAMVAAVIDTNVRSYHCIIHLRIPGMTPYL